MDIDALAGALGVETLPDTAAAAAPPTELVPLGAFGVQPGAPPLQAAPLPIAGGPSSLPAVHGLPAPARTSGVVINFKELVVGLTNDPTLSAPVKQQISELGESYSTQDKARHFSKLKELVGKERIKQIMLSLRAAPAIVDRAPKRGAPDTQQEMGGPPPTKRMRADVTDGYADASASAEAASAGGTGAGTSGATLDSQFDVLQQSGVDLAVEDAAMSVADAVAEAQRNEAAAASEAHRPFVTGAELQSRLAELAGQFGLGAVQGQAADLMAAAVEERITSVVRALRGAAWHRHDGDRTRFGEQSYHFTSNPRLPWRQRQVAAAAPPAGAATAAAAGGGAAHGGAARGAAPMVSEEERRLHAVVAAGLPRRKAPVKVSAVDVLYVIDAEPQSCRSRVVQWWRCDNRPLKRYARRAARVHVPPEGGGAGSPDGDTAVDE